METLTTLPLLIIDDFGMRKLPLTAAEDLLEIIMRRYERASTLLTSGSGHNGADFYSNVLHAMFRHPSASQRFCDACPLRLAA